MAACARHAGNASLKHTSLAWIPDGRLALLGQFDEVGDALALWRPGEDRLALRKIDLPPGGANSFVPYTVR